MTSRSSICFSGVYALAILILLQCTAFAQQPTASTDAIPTDKVFEKTVPSAVLILTGNGSGILDKVGSGIVIRNDGVILTAYHVVKDATQLQVRLKSGEIYDKVDLIGFDERRDVAALKISATNLSAAAVNSEDPKIGGRVYVISNPQSLSWTIADGLLSSIRLADEIPNAGRGFKVLQFSAPVSSGSSGGLLTDDKGQVIGIIISTLSSGQSLNFAIPIASVSGLGNSSQILMSFGRGNALELPQAIRPPTSVDVLNADPKTILAQAKLFYIYSDSELISGQMMENALMKMPEFEKWKLAIVKDIKLADIEIKVEHVLFTFDYNYSMTDRRTNILLATGKTTVWDGNLASGKFAKLIIEKLKPGREPIKAVEGKDDKKKNSN
ncbi:hypothetical protein BH10ACI2_BH10ACI2_15520 [soil metagenome]